jgi:hypothetical protein
MVSFLSAFFPCTAAAADIDSDKIIVQSSDQVRVFINDRMVSIPDSEPFINERGRIKVPARIIAQGLGADVAWDEESFTVLITGYKSITLIPGLCTATVDGAEVQLDSSAEIINNRLYVPMRFIAEALGARVQWNEKERAVNIIIENLEGPEQPDNTNIFTVVNEFTLSDEQRAFIDSVKQVKGIHHKDNLYVLALGERPNPGYGLEIVKTEMSWEQAKVYVKLKTPEPDMMYAAVISYPYLAGMAVLPPYTTISFINVETGEYI